MAESILFVVEGVKPEKQVLSSIENQFFKNKLNVVSMVFIILLFTVAIFAPFVANDKPLAIRINGVSEFSFSALQGQAV